MITPAETVRNIRLIVEMIIASHTGIAYHVERNAEGTPPHQVSVCWLVLSLRVKCRALSLSILYSERCLEGITFQIEKLKDQSQKSLRQFKILDFFGAK